MNEKYENNSHSHNRITYIYKHKDVHKRLRLLIEANKESNNIKPTPGYLYFLLLATWIHLLHSVLLRAISFVKRLPSFLFWPLSNMYARVYHSRLPSSGTLISLLCTRPNHLKWFSLILSSIYAASIFSWICSYLILSSSILQLIHLNLLIATAHIFWTCFFKCSDP